MPIYEYRCQDCHEVFQEKKSFSESDSETRCPTCGMTNTRRLLTTFAAVSSSGAVIAGGSSCSGCGSSGSGCSSCGPH